MKRLFSVLSCISLVSVLLFGISSDATAVSVQGSTPTSGVLVVSEIMERISDDLYMITTIYEEPVLTRADRYTKTAQKTRSVMNNSGECLFSVTIEASFIITSGISSTCTSASLSHEIYVNSWNYISGSSYKSGNCAYGSAEFNRKLLGIVVETRICDISLACDVNGNLS